VGFLRSKNFVVFVVFHVAALISAYAVASYIPQFSLSHRSLKVCRHYVTLHGYHTYLYLPYTTRGKKLFIIKLLVKLATHTGDRFSNVVTRFISRLTVG